MIMSKKVTKSSNKNEKLRMVLNNNLKDALDIERILSDLNIKMNIKTLYAIGCAGIIASCGDKEDGNKPETPQETLRIGDQNLTADQIKLIKGVFGIENGKLSQGDLNKYLTEYAKKQNKKFDDLKVEDLFDGNSLKKDVEGQLLEAKNTVDNEKENETEESIIGKDYDKLPEKIKEKLKKLDEHNEGFVEEFWNTIKNDNNIDELIKKNEDLKDKYDAFKKNKELIKNQLSKAGFSDDDQTKITDYISFIDDTLKVKLNNNTAKQYLLNQLKEKEKQSEIVKCVESLYKQVISEGKIKTEIKKQLKTIIKTCFEKLISEDESYKRNIEIKDTDITIEDNGKVKVKFTSKNVKNPQANEYIIEQEFFGIDTDKLKCVEIKDGNKESEKELELQKLIDAENNAFYNYTFSDEDKTELNKLITSSTSDPIKNAYEAHKKTYALKNNDPKTKNEIETEVKHLLTFVKNLVKGKDDKDKMLGSVSNISDIYKAFNSDETQGKKAFEDDIKTFLKEKMKAIADKLQNSPDSSLQDKYYKNSDINDLNTLVKDASTTDLDINGGKFLATLNTKLKEQQIAWFGDKGGATKCSIKKDINNKAAINEFEIGTDFETVKSDTCKVTNDKITTNLKNVTDLFVTELGNVINAKNLLKSDIPDNPIKNLIHDLITNKYANNDLSQISLADTDLDYDTQLNNKLTADFKKESDCKKIGDVTDADLKGYVQEAMKKVFGEQSLNSDLFAAVKELANKNTNKDNIPITDHDGTGVKAADPDKPFNQTKNRGISFINGDTLKDGGKKNAQETFAKTFGKALGKIGEALAKLQNDTTNVSDKYRDLLKVLFGTYGTDEEYDFAMKDTVFLKWLTCADEGNYGDGANAARLTSLQASLKVMSYLIFVNGTTKLVTQDTANNKANIKKMGPPVENTIADFEATDNGTKINLHVATHGIGMLATPEGLTYHFFCTATKGLWLNNQVDATHGDAAKILDEITIHTSHADSQNFQFVATAKKDAKSASSGGNCECNNFCHIMKFFGGAENYEIGVHTNGNIKATF